MHLRVRVLSPSLPGSRTKVDDAAARMAAVFVGRCLGGLDDDDDKAVIPPLPPSLPPSLPRRRTNNEGEISSGISSCPDPPAENGQ